MSGGEALGQRLESRARRLQRTVRPAFGGGQQGGRFGEIAVPGDEDRGVGVGGGRPGQAIRGLETVAWLTAAAGAAAGVGGAIGAALRRRTTGPSA